MASRQWLDEKEAWGIAVLVMEDSGYYAVYLAYHKFCSYLEYFS
jgi:hypothetical protein